MKFLEYIFSIKNKGLKKVLTILGIKITFKNKYAQIRNGYEELFSITNNKIQKLYKEQAKDLQTANDNIKKVSENIDTANKKTLLIFACQKSFSKAFAASCRINFADSKVSGKNFTLGTIKS